MTKPTKAQAHVLQLMRDGWELGVSSSMSSRRWLQKNGLGKGGDTETVHANTFNGLWSRKLIDQKKYGFPWSVWVLTETGKEIEL